MITYLMSYATRTPKRDNLESSAEQKPVKEYSLGRIKTLCLKPELLDREMNTQGLVAKLLGLLKTRIATVRQRLECKIDG